MAVAGGANSCSLVRVMITRTSNVLRVSFASTTRRFAVIFPVPAAGARIFTLGPERVLRLCKRISRSRIFSVTYCTLGYLTLTIDIYLHGGTDYPLEHPIVRCFRTAPNDCSTSFQDDDRREHRPSLCGCFMLLRNSALALGWFSRPRWSDSRGFPPPGVNLHLWCLMRLVHCGSGAVARTLVRPIFGSDSLC